MGGWLGGCKDPLVGMGWVGEGVEMDGWVRGRGGGRGGFTKERLLRLPKPGGGGEGVWSLQPIVGADSNWRQSLSHKHINSRVQATYDI